MLPHQIIDLFTITTIFFFVACSNSESVDEFGIPVSDYAYEEGSQDTTYIKDTFTDFPPSGFYPKPFTILVPDNKPLNCEIRGFVPTKDSPQQKEIRIDSTSTVRCINFYDGSNTETIRTYIFEKKPTIPTIFITTDPNSLFDPDTGIYMEGPNAEEKSPHYGANYWLDKEIPVFLEFTEANTFTPTFSKYAGLEITGRYSRMKSKKSVAITFREKYGSKRLNYPLFPNYPNLNTFKSIVLRNFGNNFGKDYIRDRLASSISEGLGVDYQQGRFVVVYYNGEYYGIHDMRERSNEHYFETHYGMNHNKINLIKADYSVSSGSSDKYVALMNWIKNNKLENEENYTYITTQIDINNYINYIQTEIFANNWDWPGYNLKIWNCTNPQTPWKWFLYDLDQSFGYEKENEPNNVFEFFLEGDTRLTNTSKHTFLFQSLLKNEKFKISFINRMAALLQMNFESQQILSKIDNMMLEIQEEISRDQKRWSHSASAMNHELDKIKQNVIGRPDVIRQQLQEFFKLGDTATVTFSIIGNGQISVHNLPLNNLPLSVKFFYGFPVTITAEPQNGAKWSNWSDGDKESTRTIYPGIDKELTAIFE